MCECLCVYLCANVCLCVHVLYIYVYMLCVDACMIVYMCVRVRDGEKKREGCNSMGQRRAEKSLLAFTKFIKYSRYKYVLYWHVTRSRVTRLSV